MVKTAACASGVATPELRKLVWLPQLVGIAKVLPPLGAEALEVVTPNSRTPEARLPPPFKAELTFWKALGHSFQVS